MIKAIIFDLDGVIVDTEPLHCKSYIQVLKNHGVELTPEEFYEYWTTQGKSIVDFVKRRHLDFNPVELRKEKIALYHEKLETELRTYDGCVKQIKELSKKYPLCLVSNSFRKDVEAIIEKTNLAQYFKFIITVEDIKKGKPDPEGFLLAASKLGIKPEEAVVVEDALKGLVAAKKAGMKCVIIPNEYTSKSDFSQADTVLRSIRSLTKEFIEGLN